VVCHRRLVRAQALGYGRVGFTTTHPAADEACEIEWRQALTLLVFSDLGVGICRCVTHHHRNSAQADALRRTPAFGAKANLMPTIGICRMNNDGLQDAVLTNVLGKLVELGFRHFGARVLRVGEQAAHRQYQGLSGSAACWCHHHIRQDFKAQQIKLKMARVFAWRTHACIVLLLCKKR
jgi:hypothetical protein